MPITRTIASNPCPRCGKDRIVIKTWEEKSSSGVLTYTLTSCPDAECQKKVDGDIQKETDRRTAQKHEADLREQARLEHIAEARMN